MEIMTLYIGNIKSVVGTYNYGRFMRESCISSMNINEDKLNNNKIYALIKFDIENSLNVITNLFTDAYRDENLYTGDTNLMGLYLSDTNEVIKRYNKTNGDKVEDRYLVEFEPTLDKPIDDIVSTIHNLEYAKIKLEKMKKKQSTIQNIFSSFSNNLISFFS